MVYVTNPGDNELLVKERKLSKEQKEFLKDCKKLLDEVKNG